MREDYEDLEEMLTSILAAAIAGALLISVFIVYTVGATVLAGV